MILSLRPIMFTPIMHYSLHRNQIPGYIYFFHIYTFYTIQDSCSRSLRSTTSSLCSFHTLNKKERIKTDNYKKISNLQNKRTRKTEIKFPVPKLNILYSNALPRFSSTGIRDGATKRIMNFRNGR
jgi:hypothetical protein